MIAYFATVVKNTGTQTTVLCPHCKKTHKHGNAGNPDIVGETRMPDCKSGKEYMILNEKPDLDEYDFCKFCKWNPAYENSHVVHSAYNKRCPYVIRDWNITFDEEGEVTCTRK